MESGEIINTEEKTRIAWETLNETLENKVEKKESITWGYSTQGKIFLTTKQLIFANEDSQPIPIPLEVIRKVYLAKDKKLAELTNSGKRLQVFIALEKGGYAFAPKEQLTTGDKMELLSRAFGNPPIRGLSPSQGQLARSWVAQIENAVRDRKITILQKDTIQAWKCEYCEALNEAEKEKCSNCGSPRRGGKS